MPPQAMQDAMNAEPMKLGKNISWGIPAQSDEKQGQYGDTFSGKDSDSIIRRATLRAAELQLMTEAEEEKAKQ